MNENKKIRVLYLTPLFPSYENDSTGSYILDSIISVMSSGVEVEVVHVTSWKPTKSLSMLCTNKNRLTSIKNINIKKISVFSIPRLYFRSVSNYIYTMYVSRYIIKMYRNKPFDLIHAHTEIVGLAATRASRKLSIPCITTIHGVELSIRMWKGLAGKMIYNSLNSSSKVILVGNVLKERFLPYIDNSKIRIVNNGYKHTKLHSEALINRGFVNLPNYKIISVSNLHEQKGIHFLIKALYELKELGYHHWKYTIVGDGYYKKNLVSLVHDLKLHNNISFVGSCSHAEVFHFLSQNDIFCLPSYCEAFSIANLEAMSMGLVSIAVENQGPSDFIEHGVTGLLVEPKSVISLVNAFENIFTDKIDVATISKSGREFALNNLQWKDHAAKLVNLYNEELLAR